MRGSQRRQPGHGGAAARARVDPDHEHGPAPIDLEPYRLISKPYSYAFAPDSIVQPGETMRVRLYESGDEDSALTRYWATNGPILNNGGDVIELRRFDDVLADVHRVGQPVVLK